MRNAARSLPIMDACLDRPVLLVATVYSYLLGVTVLKMGMSGLLDLYDSTAVPCQGNYLNFVSHFCCVGDKSLEFRLRFLCFCTGSAVRVLKGLNANFSYTAMGMYRRL